MYSTVGTKMSCQIAPGSVPGLVSTQPGQLPLTRLALNPHYPVQNTHYQKDI